MILRTVVVDDEAPARNRLRKFLSQSPEVEVVAECASGPEAIECIQREHPDLVFLDVQMPEVSGLDVARALPPEKQPIIIFVTAHDRHAVEAFEVRAMDYLLKPFTRVRLQETLKRARQRMQSPSASKTEQSLATGAPATKNYLNRFAVRDGRQTVLIKTQDVDYIEAAANYVVLCTGNKNYILRETIRNLEAVLSPALFVRISRSIIVNIDRIKAINSDLPGEWQVVLQNGRELQMSRGLKEIQERLQYSSTPPPAGIS
jgi:two-component system LytT family response regulator